MFKTLPIDALLRWALCEELPKGQPMSASAWEAVTRNLLLVMRVDVSKTGGGDGLGSVPGDPNPDAVIIAAELRRLTKAHGELAALDPEAANALAGIPFNLTALLRRTAVVRAGRCSYDRINPGAGCRSRRLVLGAAVAHLPRYSRRSPGMQRAANAMAATSISVSGAHASRFISCTAPRSRSSCRKINRAMHSIPRRPPCWPSASITS